MAARRSATPREDPVLDELRTLRVTVAALTQQLGLAMETLSLMRADQMKLARHAGLLDENDPRLPEVHRCDEGHHHPHETTKKRRS